MASQPTKAGSTSTPSGTPDDSSHVEAPRRVVPRTIGRFALAAALATAGVGHLTVSRQEFQAQVPPWLPLDPDLVVVTSGVAELGLAAALALAPRKHQWLVGWIVAVFFVAIFPGNISQYVTGTDGFGLDTDRARAVRLLFQPLLVLWALWSTGAWHATATRRRRGGTQKGPPRWGGPFCVHLCALTGLVFEARAADASGR